MHSWEQHTVYLHEDNDMHFSYVPNNTTPHHTLGRDTVVDDIEDGRDYDGEICLEEHHFIGQICGIPVGMVESNGA